MLMARGGKARDMLPVLEIELGKEMLRQQHDVPLALNKVRHHDGKNIQTVIQVFTEFVFRH